ncbi:O-antigen ligase family protein [Tenacibaculum jejuense]|uniref:O-antigen ligase-related domain-containing protein n=1 Tax=Tenacibaculum jejuense TaxID=584609 RepID=A0A238UHE0_9FLAO|nr:O-antigen ligase family protein [Tenacibaculum jejuense]SNR17700.1 membrane protein of unknown function [Tenacibaculum jejuense]
MVKKLFHGFVFFAPFTSFFALSAWLRLPVIVNQFLFFITLSSVFTFKKIHKKWLLKEDIYLLTFFGLMWLSFLLGFKEKRSFNHSLAYTNAILFFFFLGKYVVKKFNISSFQIAKTIFFSFISVSVIIIVDFIGINFFEVSFRKVFSVADGKISNMDYYIRSGFRRVGGVAEEPGTMALFYNLYFGISLFYLTINRQKKHLKYLVLLFLISHFAMFSSAGIALAIFSGISIFIYEKIKRNKINKKQINIIFLLLSTIVIITLILLTFNLGGIRLHLSDFIDKILFNETGSYTSSGQRLYQWKRALTNFIHHPIFGYGPGYGVHEDHEGYLSVYFTVLSDLGIVAFIFFIGFQEAIFKKTLQMNRLIRPFILFSIITSFLHLCILSDFYHAPLWILLLFIQLVYLEQKEKKLW